MTPSLLLAIFLLFSNPISSSVITKQMTDYLKKTVTWEVASYEENLFKSWTDEEISRLFSAEPISLEELSQIEPYTASPESLLSLPKEFDARKTWPKCVYPIRNQGKCGSCWAHGCTESLSDRYCIHGVDVNLAPQDLVSCDKANNGCQGGNGYTSFKYLVNTGAVTEACFPYTSANFDVPPCPSNGKCPGGEDIAYKKYFCEQGSFKYIAYQIEMTKAQIMNFGPVEDWMVPCEDFLYYKGGIYYHKSGKCYTGHFMKTIGWGVEDGINFWLIANSMGTEWGEKGYVRFKMGDCSIDAVHLFCSPRL